MKKKLVEETKPTKADKSGRWITVQQVKEILILNIFRNKVLQARHCINAKTGEYATLRNGRWMTRMLDEAIELKTAGWHLYYSNKEIEKHFRMSEEDKKLICEALCAEDEPEYRREAYRIISYKEEKYGREKREKTEQNRVNKVNAIMEKIPEIPQGITEWINQKEIGREDYAMKNRETGKWSCSHCGEEFEGERLNRADGEKPRNNDMVICPACKKEIKYLTRKKKVDIITHFALVQPIDKEISVVRYFDAEIQCIGGRKRIGIDEAVRIVLKKRMYGLAHNYYPACTIYYNQYGLGVEWVEEGVTHKGHFDNKSNRANRREYAGYLYDAGIEEALKGTAYKEWARLFEQMAAAGLKLNYNKLMIMRDRNFISVIEMLFKGRFYKLLEETSENVSIWAERYVGMLRMAGNTIEDVFDIGDRQKINRIREKNGGELMVNWMRWSDRHHTKISDKALQWVMKNNIEYKEMQWMLQRMSLEQAMNYVERQKKESYKGKNAKQVISAYEDYMAMCDKLHKDTRDEMIYRPRELKRRHNEAVGAIEQMRAQLKAEEYSKKFSEAEQVLKAIKEKYEYAGEDYFIIVPQRIVDIVAEGNYLHHCAGATDRYFDRIKQHETYICFLRKTNEPDTPFYTIEVEPGGTIRQHRGYLDEEPEIDKIKPFLREWQKEIKKRMSKRDIELAEVSKVKREENIKELKEKNNTRVLNGLMQDFMEAM